MCIYSLLKGRVSLSGPKKTKCLLWPLRAQSKIKYQPTMSRVKRSSKAITVAEKRLSGIISIDPQLDLGNGNTAAAYQDKITSTQTKFDNYNTMLSALDLAQNELIAAEIELEVFNTNMLLSVGIKYGRDSNQYEQAGGTRISERKTGYRKTKTPPSTK